MHRTIASCALAVCLLSTLWSQQATQQAENATLTDDDYAVYSVALKSLVPKGKVDSIVLLDRTGLGVPPGMVVVTQFGEKTKKFVNKDVPDELRKSFDERNKSSATIAVGKIALDARITTLPDEQAKKMVEPSYGWDAFAKQYTGSAGIVLLGLPGFNAAKHQALLYIGYSCGTLCGEGKLLLLAKKSGQWEVMKEVTVWS